MVKLRWIFSLLILNFLDWFSTTIWVVIMGPDVELNPVMRFILELPAGLVWFAIIKLGLVPHLILTTLHHASLRTCKVLVLLYSIVVASNFLGLVCYFLR